MGLYNIKKYYSYLKYAQMKNNIFFTELDKFYDFIRKVIHENSKIEKFNTNVFDKIKAKDKDQRSCYETPSCETSSKTIKNL